MKSEVSRERNGEVGSNRRHHSGTGWKMVQQQGIGFAQLYPTPLGVKGQAKPKPKLRLLQGDLGEIERNKTFSAFVEKEQAGLQI